MLIEFRLSNYRSFKDEQTLSLVANTDASLPDNLLIPGGSAKIHLLRSVVVYGPNASGKTKLLEALYFVKDFVLTSGTRNPSSPIDADPFRLDPASLSEPSTFEISFFQGGVRYQYGFAVDRRRVYQEYLYAAPRGRTVPYFQREWDEKTGQENYFFGPSLKGQNEKIRALTRDNALFLSVAAALNHPVLMDVYAWFGKIGYEGSAVFSALLVSEIDEQYHPRMKELLRFADLGITDYRMKDSDARATGSIPLAGANIEILHESPSQEVVAFPLYLESNGTRQILYLGKSVLKALEEGGILAIDELDASLHPLLVREMIHLFHNPEANRKGAQLIFNTHDTTLLDPALFRRDQIWFTEKDQQGASHLYSLLDYSPRKGESLAKGYLQGRYGAIPFLGEPSAIFEQEPC